MTRDHGAPPPLPAGATWRRFGRYSAHAGQWSVSLPGYVAAARVERTGASGPAAWSAHCRGITAGGFRTRDLAARHAFAAAGFLPLPTGQAERVAANRRRAAASPPCPDCGQGRPDGCDADCPTRWEDDPRAVVAYDAPAGTLCPVCGEREHWRDASPVFYPSGEADAIPAGATCAGCGEVLVTEE